MRTPSLIDIFFLERPRCHTKLLDRCTFNVQCKRIRYQLHTWRTLCDTALAFPHKFDNTVPPCRRVFLDIRWALPDTLQLLPVLPMWKKIIFEVSLPAKAIAHQLWCIIHKRLSLHYFFHIDCISFFQKNSPIKLDGAVFLCLIFVLMVEQIFHSIRCVTSQKLTIPKG